MRAGRLKTYIAVVEDASGGTYEYVVHAGRQSDAEKQVRDAAPQWGASLVEVKRAVAPRTRTWRWQIVLGVTIVVAAVAIVVAAVAIVSERVGGVL
jgi:hypothetical protein